MKSEQKSLLVIFISFGIFLLAFIFFTGYNGLYGQDSHEYLRYCKELIKFFKTGEVPGNFFWPIGYPLAGALLSFITGPHLAMQLIPVLSCCWIMVILAAYLMNEFPGREKEISLYVFLFLGFSPYFLRYSISVMSDIPSVALLVTSYYCLDRYMKIKKAIFILIASFMVSATIFTRIGLLPLTLPVWIFIFKSYFRKNNLQLIIPTLVLILLPATIYSFFKGTDVSIVSQNYQLTDWSVLNFFKREFSNPDGYLSYSLPNIVFVFLSFIHPGYVFAGILFIFQFFINKQQPSYFITPLVLAILLYLFFLSGLPLQNSRFMIPVLPFFLLICFPSFLSYLSWFHFKKKLLMLAITLLLIFQSILVYRAFLPFYTLNKKELKIASSVLVHSSDIIYTFGIDGALKSYGYEGKIINMYHSPLTSVASGSMMVFNPGEFSKQWAGKNPMNNYDFILKSGKARLIATVESGWEIYRVE